MNEGNKHAEKWTEETVMQKITEMQKELDTDQKKDIENCRYLTIGSLLYSCDLYGEIWSYWKEKFKDNETVFKSVKKIDTFFENRLYEGGLKNKLNSKIVGLGLNRNYKWVEQKQLDISVDNKLNEKEVLEELQKLGIDPSRIKS